MIHRIAFVSGSALAAHRAARGALGPVAGISLHACRLHTRNTYAHAVALRSAGLHRAAALARGAFGSGRVFRTRAGTIALTILSARRRRLSGAFTVRIRAILDRTANAVGALAFLRRRTRFATAIAGRVATHAVDTEARTAFIRHHARRPG